MDNLEGLRQASERVEETARHLEEARATRDRLIAQARDDGVPWQQLQASTGLSSATIQAALSRARKMKP